MMGARGRLLACCAHSTVAARVEARLATGGMWLWLPWIVLAQLTLIGDLRGGAARRGGLGHKGAWGCLGVAGGPHAGDACWVLATSCGPPSPSVTMKRSSTVAGHL